MFINTKFGATLLLVSGVVSAETQAQAAPGTVAPAAQGPRASLRDQYKAYEFNIPMRDGTKLYTVVWVPNELKGSAPILMERTPYGAGTPATGPRRSTRPVVEAKYILAYQDVRGKGKSEGDFVNTRPMATGSVTIDETTDTYDTCEFLVKNVPSNNGSIGLWGISYPGFYAGIGAVNNHPALKAVSPQAPVNDWFLGDDCHHNGVLFLQETFDFCAGFDVPRGGQRPVIDRQGKSAYQFYLDTGPLANLDKLHLKGLVPYWTEELMAHDTYDQYWKDRSLSRNFKNVKCAVLTVGGWFDKEDLWGALNLYKYGEKQNATANTLVMGPWSHGGWTGPGSSLGEVKFYSTTGDYYKEKIEFPFFEKYLNDKGVPAPAEAHIFETGANKWHTFSAWPPKGLKDVPVYLGPEKSLSQEPLRGTQEDAYVYDPSKPTPYLSDWENSKRAPGDWLIWNQEIFSKRSDVLTYTSPALEENTQFLGPITADLWVKTTGTDCDLVVKVIDVYPSETSEVSAKDEKKSMANFQMMVRSDIFRAKFRNSFEKPEPMVPGRATRIKFDLNDMMHTFKKGHKIMIQIQSSWFPIADRNPNKFMNIHQATAADFQPATISILRGGRLGSKIVFRKFGR
jgi:uncharacterized protein